MSSGATSAYSASVKSLGSRRPRRSAARATARVSPGTAAAQSRPTVTAVPATVVVQARLRDLNPQLEEAAMDLGARPPQVFWLVTLPMIAQSLVSAWLLTFTISLDDVVIAAFLSGPGSTTMPLVIFSRARLGLNPSVNAVATIIVVVVAVGVVVASWLIARAERRRMIEMAAAQRH